MGFGNIGFYGFDRTYLLVLAGFLICTLASARMKSTFSKYSRVRSSCGLTGAQAAQRVLQYAGITDVRIQAVGGKLTDHYDPRNKTVNLSESVCNNTSLAAICVAAHECGHAVQHHKKYAPLSLRSAIVPIANLGSTLAWPIFFAGLLFSIPPLLNVGIILFSAAVIFQLVTLPVETNASGRALRMLRETGILGSEELSGGRRVLTAAAMTYVAALASSILQLLRLIIISGGRRRD